MAELIQDGKASRIATEQYVNDKLGGSASDYGRLSGKPTINGVTVNGEQTGADLGLADLTVAQNLQSAIANEIEVRSEADAAVEQRINQSLLLYRKAVDQNTLDAAKVAKTDFTDATVNPNGFVLLWLQPNFSADAVSISYAGMQPSTGAFTPGNVALPFASVSAAGMMAKEDKQTLDNLTERMTAVEQGLSTERFVDTKEELLAVDTTALPIWTPYLVRSDADHANAATKYYYYPEGENPTANGFVFGIVVQEVPYSVATATTLGLALSSTLAGQVQFKGTGVGSVNGWDELQALLNEVDTYTGALYGLITNHSHKLGTGTRQLSYNDLLDTPVIRQGLVGLRFTGTQYIDSSIVGSSTTLFSITCKILTGVSATQRGLLGSRTGSSSALFQMSSSTSGNKSWGIGTRQNTLSPGETPINTVLTIHSPAVNNRAVNGVAAANGALPYPSAFDDTNTILIGTTNTDNGAYSPGFDGIIYACTLYNASGRLRNFIAVEKGNTFYSTTPAPSNCFWDTVSQSYFENAGVGIIDIE